MRRDEKRRGYSSQVISGGSLVFASFAIAPSNRILCKFKNNAISRYCQESRNEYRFYIDTCVEGTACWNWGNLQAISTKTFLNSSRSNKITLKGKSWARGKGKLLLIPSFASTAETDFMLRYFSHFSWKDILTNNSSPNMIVQKCKGYLPDSLRRECH